MPTEYREPAHCHSLSAFFWSSSYVTSHYLALAPQFNVKY